MIILERLEYIRVLEVFSMPRMETVEWRLDDSNNVEALNETVDLYRYLDHKARYTASYHAVANPYYKNI